MLGLDWAPWLAMHLPALSFFHALLAYVGMGPGPEFIPYFMALLGVIGAALIAIVQWPIVALFRWFKSKHSRGADAETSSAADAPAPREVGGKPTQ